MMASKRLSVIVINKNIIAIWDSVPNLQVVGTPCCNDVCINELPCDFRQSFSDASAIWNAAVCVTVLFELFDY